MYRRREDLERFVTVAESGSLTAAAKRLGIASKTLQNVISELEQHCGAPLFERQGQRVRLTPFGAQLLEPVKKVLHEDRALEEEISAVRRAATGDQVVKCSIRFPVDLNRRIDLAVAASGGDVSKRHWITEAVLVKLEQEGA